MKTLNNQKPKAQPEIALPKTAVPLKKRLRLKIAMLLGDRKVMPRGAKRIARKPQKTVFVCAALLACVAPIWVLSSQNARQKAPPEAAVKETKTSAAPKEKIVQTTVSAVKSTPSGDKTAPRQTAPTPDEYEVIELNSGDSALMQARPKSQSPPQPQPTQPRAESVESEQPDAKPSTRIAQPFYQP